jgi:CubicO group peptidase (beta-lactamase class C family)
MAVPAPAFAQGKAEKIDEMMSLYHRFGSFNGSVLVAENGRVIYKRGFGLANMEWEIPNRPDTRFRLGSITKQFTAALVMQLVEQGKVKLDEKLSTYLPDYRKDVGDRVTIHHLLTHTSGIPSYTSQPGFFQNVSRNPYAVDEFVKKYASGDLEYEPGSKFSYNNSGYFLLGAIIEKVTGKPYEQALRENILDPLGMKDTGYDRHGTILKRRAAGYVKAPTGYENAPYLDMSIPYAAGSLYSTVEDLYLWDQALYGEKVLSAKSREVMFTPFLEHYAYGWGVNMVATAEGKEGTAIAHSGGINGFSTLITRMVDDRHLVVLLDNTSQGGKLEEITRSIAGVLYDRPYTPPRQPIADVLLKTIVESNVEAAVRQYRELKAASPDAYDFGEGELNRLGYQLLGMRRVADAVEVFKLNVEAYPKSANPYDSLAEAYMTSGNKELAVASYRKSLELDPKNANAKERLAKLEAPPAKVDPAVLDSYVGQYELGPGFILTVRREGDKLVGEPTGQPKAELVPESETRFLVALANAVVTFTKDADGRVTGLVLSQRGRDMPAKKIQ